MQDYFHNTLFDDVPAFFLKNSAVKPLGPEALSADRSQTALLISSSVNGVSSWDGTPRGCQFRGLVVGLGTPMESSKWFSRMCKVK